MDKVKNNIIYQSNKLIESSYSLTVFEQKILRILASMVKKDDLDFKEYIFNVPQLKKILGVNSNNFNKELDKLTDLLMTRFVKIYRDDDFDKYHFVDVAKYKNGVLTLKINPEMKIFYLNLDWYTKYKLSNVLKFKSVYSFRVYELLKQYENIGSRIINIDELRKKLDLGKNIYQKYSNFKMKVLLKSQKEINNFTDISFEFEEIKTGRKVTSIKFNIKSKAQEEITATVEPIKKNCQVNTKKTNTWNDYNQRQYDVTLEELARKKILDKVTAGQKTS